MTCYFCRAVFLTFCVMMDDLPLLNWLWPKACPSCKVLSEPGLAVFLPVCCNSDFACIQLSWLREAETLRLSSLFGFWCDPKDFLSMFFIIESNPSLVRSFKSKSELSRCDGLPFWLRTLYLTGLTNYSAKRSAFSRSIWWSSCQWPRTSLTSFTFAKFWRSGVIFHNSVSVRSSYHDRMGIAFSGYGR